MPVIVITGYDDAQTAGHMRHTDIVTCLQKPFGADILLAALRQALGR